MNKKNISLIYTFVFLLLFGCNFFTSTPNDLYPEKTEVGNSGPDIASQNTSIPQNPTASPTPYPGKGPYEFDDNINPLTGLRVNDASLLERRPVAFKINNYPRSNRPQWGLSLADIVYEYYHNNELPRFHAIFYGNDASQVGPIRSARFVADYRVAMYKSIFVFGSADSRILDRLTSQDYAKRLIYILDGECPPKPVCRYDPQGPNYLVGNTNGARQYVQSLGVNNTRPRLEGMWFQKKNIASVGMSLQRLTLRYSYSAYLYWEYDPETNKYLRYQDTQEDIGGAGEVFAPISDRLNGQQISTSNVVLLFVPHSFFYYLPPQNGKPSVEVVDMDFEGRGKAYAMRDGHMFKLEWVRTGNDLLYLVFPNGDRYPFTPGNTWFQVVGKETTLEKENNNWRFTFSFD
ncbi:MAG: DUF3048 domain-containing protein [Chloroflexota bacterium]